MPIEIQMAQNKPKSVAVGSHGSPGVISEASGKRLLNGRVLGRQPAAEVRCVTVDYETNWEELSQGNPWLETQPSLVVKPDQSIKRRKQLGLIKLNVDFESAKHWIQEKLGSRIEVDGVEGTLKQFLIEPFLPHQQNEEFYVCIHPDTVSQDVVLFHHEGGVDMGNVDQKALRLSIGLTEVVSEQAIQCQLLKNVSDEKKEMLTNFIQSLVLCFRELHFTYLEINPLVVTESEIHILDVAAKVDLKAAPLCKEQWGVLQFAPSLCRDLHPAERYAQELSANTPANMNLTLLNKSGRIWSIIFGGGSSLVLCDTAVSLGSKDEIACYTQFSGVLTVDQVYEFTKMLIGLMTEERNPGGKALIVGSAVTDIVVMLQLRMGPPMALLKALQENKEVLQSHNISLLIRRPTTIPLPKEKIPGVLMDLGIPVHTFTLESLATELIQCALGLLADIKGDISATKTCSQQDKLLAPKTNICNSESSNPKEITPQLFSSETRVIVIGLMARAVQAMLDFDFVCSRKAPSVAAIVSPGGDKVKDESFLWGESTIDIPVYLDVATALNNHRDVSVIVNSAFGMDAFRCTMQAMKYERICCIMMLVGNIPEQQTRTLVQMAKNNDILILGPCMGTHIMQVNFIKPGCFRANKLGNIGGGLDDVISLKLYQPGSVGLVSCSGGLSMEAIVMIARNTDGLYQGVSLGGGKFVGSSFMEHFSSLEANPDVKILLLLGEFGGCAEYAVCEALRSGKITKPIIAFCVGECEDMFKSEPGYFGHAGAGNSLMETAVAKNKALAEAGAIVPKMFDEIGGKLREVYSQIVSEGKLVPKPEPLVPSIPDNMKPRKGKK